MSILPPSKPRINQTLCMTILNHNLLSLHEVYLICIRGYYLDSMGKPGVTDRGVYDSAMIWLTPSIMSVFNGNTNPSRYRKGWGFGREKGMASLKPGIWSYKTGIHYGSIPHAAFRQNKEVTVLRDGTKGTYEDTGFFGINVHRGGSNGTSSLGCLTLPPSQWDDFKKIGYSELKNLGQKSFNLLLIEETEIRKGNFKLY